METPIGHMRKGIVMAVRSIRSVVARFVVVTGLAASLLAGSSALVQPSHASAANFYCIMGDYYQALQAGAFALGNERLGERYAEIAADFYEYC
jgi:hypothetical protein